LEGFVDINVSVSKIRRATGSTSLLRRDRQIDIPNRVNEKPYSPICQGLRAKRRGILITSMGDALYWIQPGEA
jgi:hypothetical protein